MLGCKAVETARANFWKALRADSSAELPPDGWRWHAYRLHARRDINKFKTPIEALHSVQAPGSAAGYEARMTGRALIEYARAAECGIKSAFPEFSYSLPSFQESDLSHPDTLVIMNGRLVSSQFYSHIAHSMTCVRYVKPDTVLEIGGGYGAPGRIWMSNGLHRPQRYIDVDFPESLFFAEIYFRICLPEMNVTYLHADEALPNPAEDQIILCPISQLHRLQDTKIEIITNTGSLQEMSDEYVTFYMNKIDSMNCDLFYSANYFGQPIDNLAEGMNFAAPVMKSNWQLGFHQAGGASDRPSMQALYHRVSSEQDADALARQSLSKNGAIDISEAFLLFDATRHSADPELINSAVSSLMKRMAYVPKETLYLARRALTLRGRPQEAATVKLLEKLATAGRANMGIVEAGAAGIRDSLMLGKECLSVPAGRLVHHDDGDHIEIEGEIRRWRGGIWGALEEIGPDYVTGWAADRDKPEAAKFIHVLVADALIASAVPSIHRREFRVPDLHSGFKIVPIPIGSHPNEVLAVAEFADGTIGRLSR